MRLYLDSNVFGAYPPYVAWQGAAADRLFERLRGGDYQLVTSTLVTAEIADAPLSVQTVLTGLAMLPGCDWIYESPASDALADAYIRAGVITQRHIDDATHVALATIAGCDALATWNVSDFVNKATAYNHVNVQEGYATLDILTPDVILQVYP